MSLLFIDTSRQCVEIIIKSENYLTGLTFNTQKNVSELIFKNIDIICDMTEKTLSEIDSYGCISGPGSFTGLRVGVSIIKSLGFQQDKMVYFLNSLKLMALNVRCNRTLIPIIFDINNKIFCGMYKWEADILKEKQSVKHIEYSAISGLVSNENNPVFLVEQSMAHKIKDNIVPEDRIIYINTSLTVLKNINEKNFDIVDSDRIEFLEPEYFRLSQIELRMTR